MLILCLVVCWADGATAHAVGTMYAGSTASSPWAAMLAATKKIPYLVSVCFTVSFIFMVVYVCCIMLFLGIGYALEGGYAALPIMLFLFAATATFISLILYLMYPIVMVEHHGVQEAIQRSHKLMIGNFGTVFCVLLVYGLVKSALSVLVIIFTITVDYDSSTNHSSGQVAYWARTSLSFLINTTFLGIFSILKAVLYFHIRVKDEQLDQDRLQQDMGISPQSVYTDMASTISIQVRARTDQEQYTIL